MGRVDEGMMMSRELLQQALDALSAEHHFGDYDALCAALREALAAPEPEPLALESVHLTRDTRGMCVVRVNGRVAIRDNGDIIDHMATLEWFAAPPATRAPAAPVPDGWAMVPNYRGYVAFGTGQYLLDISAEANPAELIIHMATDAEKAGRTVGDLCERPNPDEFIQPEKIAVRLAFFTVAGLDALEQQLRLLRKEHFAASPAAPVVPIDSKLADAYLAALLRYTGNFYGVAMERGLPAGQTANMVAHVESAARALHKMALSAAPVVPLTDDMVAHLEQQAFASTNYTPERALYQHWFRVGVRAGYGITGGGNG